MVRFVVVVVDDNLLGEREFAEFLVAGEGGRRKIWELTMLLRELSTAYLNGQAEAIVAVRSYGGG